MIEPQGNRRTLRAYAAGLVLSAAYAVALSIYLSTHRIMWADELTGLYIIRDPSWRHAFESWSRASDSGGPLFYIVGHFIVFLFGPRPWVLRLFSALCLWLAAVLWFNLLRQKFSTASAFFSCVLVWLCDGLYVNNLGELRFYGELIFATAITAVMMIRMEDRKPRPAICFLIMAATGSLLVTIHMLGVVYSAVFIATLVFSRLPLPQRAAAIFGNLSAWLLVLLFRSAIKNGAAAYTWVVKPSTLSLLRYYIHTPLYVFAHPIGSVLANMALGALALYGIILAWKRSRTVKETDDGRRLLVILFGFLLLLPLGVFIVSHLVKPVWVNRYMMPYDLGLAGACTGTLWLMGQRFRSEQTHRLLPWIGAGSFLALLTWHVLTLREEGLRPYSTIEPYLTLKPSLPLVLQDGNSFLAAHYYEPRAASRIYFALRRGDTGTLVGVQQSGYEVGLVDDEQFLATHKDFFYLDVPWAHEHFLEHWKSLHSNLRVVSVGSLPYQGISVPLLEITQ